MCCLRARPWENDSQGDTGLTRLPCVCAQAAQHAEDAETGAAAEWERWMRACRVGLRRPLGSDMQRRRYWALGGRAGAFCVYVEQDEGRRWGWYEGARLHLCFI